MSCAKDHDSGGTRLPFDQHSVMALVAPRALLATQGKYDSWTNPQGSALAWRAALPVFSFLGVTDHLAAAWDDSAHEFTQKHLDTVLHYMDLLFQGTPAESDFQALPAEFPDDPTAPPWIAP
jgi:hypothetical protein